MSNESLPHMNQAQTREETDKKCPACGGTMDFSPETGGLLCPYCGHAEQIPLEKAAPQSAEELDFDLAESTGNCDWGAEKKTVICNSCGAQAVYDALQISDVCPYCGSNQVMEEKGKNTLAPGGVVPFLVTLQQAQEKFWSWLKKKLFTPRAAKRSARPEAFKGVYLPYWTFDTNTFSAYSARYGINRTVRGSDGKTKTRTDWYSTQGSYSRMIDDQLVVGTNRIDRGILSRIEPFRTEENKSYRPEYVAGFISERYSIGLKDAWEHGKQMIRSRLSNEIEQKIRAQHRADIVRLLRLDVSYSDITYKYLLLPVWLSSFEYKQKIYQFVVNGQTGKVGGKAPVSALRVLLLILLILAFVVGVFLLNFYFGE